MALSQNFHDFAPRNIGMNKNGVLAENKINLCLKQNKIKKRYQAESKINLYLNKNKIKKDTRQIPKTRFDTSDVLEKRKENFPWNQRDRYGFQKIHKLV